MNSAAGKKSQRQAHGVNELDKAHLPCGHPLVQKRIYFIQLLICNDIISCVENGPLLKSLNLTQVVYLHIHNENISVFIHVHALLENLLTEKLSEDVQSQIKSTSLE